MSLMLTKVLHFSDICKKAARFCTNSLVQRKGKREKRTSKRLTVLPRKEAYRKN